jgi:phosphate-selective porin OprO/OprP
LFHRVPVRRLTSSTLAILFLFLALALATRQAAAQSTPGGAAIPDTGAAQAAPAAAPALPPPAAPTPAEVDLANRVADAEQASRIAVRRVEILEEQLATKAKDAAAKPPAFATASEKDGFSVRSADGAFMLKIHGQLQVDSRWFLDDGVLSDKADTFLVRRMRPSVDGTLLNIADFKITPEFAGGTTQVFDAYIDIHPFPWLHLRAGKFKAPLGLERLQQDQDLPLMERALTQNLTSQRDVGAELWGDIAGGIVQYRLAILNGATDAALQDVDTNHAKDFAGRVLIQPFKAESLKELGALGLHFGASTGNRFGIPTSTLLPSFKSGGQNTIFTYLAPAATADPTGAGTPFAHLRQSRLNPGLFYYFGPFGVLSEYVWNRQEVQKGNTTMNLTNQAFHATASIVIGGTNGFNGATPSSSLDLSKGTWGALEIAARWNMLKIDGDAFGNAADPTVPVFADNTKAVSKAQGFTGALTYVPSRTWRLTVNFDRTSFTAGSSVSTSTTDPATMKTTTTKTVSNRNTENALLARAQVYF